jgi:hypothetical protein
MGHAINGFIGRTAELLSHLFEMPSAMPCSLSQGYLILPITESMVSEDDMASNHGNFIRFTRPLEEWAIALSQYSPIAYIETDFFGGIGEQQAICWSHSSILCGPLTSNERTPLPQGAINQVLQALGVTRGNACDEFAALGLDRYRENEDWIEKGNVPQK